MPSKPSTTSRPKSLTAYWDASRRTCIMVRQAGSDVLHIPLVTGKPLRIMSTKEPAFNVLWKPIPDYPIEKAAKIMLRFTQDLGATKDVMEALSGVVKVSSAQREQAAAVLAKVQQPAPKAKAKGPY
ncbi:MAG: hypothetical protein V4498_00640 [candidate division FCPU426 bacterium]